MCGRYVFQTGRHFWQQFEIDVFGFEPSDSFNIAPTQIIPGIIVQDGQRKLLPFRWGLVPSWAKDLSIGSKMINARSETLHEKPSFRTAFRKRRCLIPASGFYEWQKQPGGPKQPLFIYLKNNAPFAFAGLWEIWKPKDGGDPVHSCTIITTTPNDFMAPIHHRMPVILRPEHYDTWLDPEIEDTRKLKEMLTPYQPEEMACHTVSTVVNAPLNNSEENIQPIDKG